MASIGRAGAGMRIEKDTTVRGSFQVEGELVVEGTLEGKVFVTGRLEIAPTGVLTGEATCTGGAILGRLSGIVHSGEPVSVSSDAVVSGRVVAPALDFGGAEQTLAARSVPEEPRQPRPAGRPARPPTVTGDESQVIVRPGAVLRNGS
jgi:cytoskeletal protein CcmA (bactofilin family)